MDNIVELLVETSFAFIFILGVTFTVLLARETGKLLESTKYNLYHGNFIMCEEHIL